MNKIGKNKKMSVEEFIEKSKSIYGDDKFDYSLCNSDNLRTGPIIICKKHGNFKTNRSNHISKNKSGCPTCRKESLSNRCKSKQIKYEDFVIRANAIHYNKYDYSLSINNYRNGQSKISIICPIHGIFIQRAQSHLDGCGCFICGKTKKYKISEPEVRWLDSLGVPDDINHRQVRIMNFIVDGIDHRNKIIYEFNGDYWHGNPDKFDTDCINKDAGKTFGKLYSDTIRKKEILESIGYKVISIWESEFIKTQKKV
jgi:hypothetical protein